MCAKVLERFNLIKEIYWLVYLYQRNMENFKTTFLIRCLLILSSQYPNLCMGQTGSSFFYYISPNQPMVVNSQTFGSNPKAYHHISNSNPFEFIPSDQTRESYPTGSPFLPHRNAYQSQLLDKIAFTNAPASYPSSSQTPQYHYNYEVNAEDNQSPPPPPTQPSAKLFNFLNQPFQFFQNSFNRFHNQQQEQITSPPPQTYHDDNNNGHLQSQDFKQTSPEEENRQNFYNTYYDQGIASPGRFALQNPKTTPLTFSVNQYFTTKTSKGPASYTFTIEANPTVGPTAKVQVSLGSDSLPATFPTLPSSLFVRPDLSNETRKDDERDNVVNQGEDDKYYDYEEEPVVVTTTPMTATTTTVVAPVEVTVVDPVQTPPTPVTELEPPSLSGSTTPVIPETTPLTPVTPETTQVPSTTITPTTTSATTPTSSTTTTSAPMIDIDQENNSNNRKPVKRVIIVRKKLVSGNKRVLTNDKVPVVVETADPQQNELTNFGNIIQSLENATAAAVTMTIIPSTTLLPPSPPPPPQRVKRPKLRPSSTTTTTAAAIIEEEIEPASSSPLPQLSPTTQRQLIDDVPTTFRYKQRNDYFIEPLTTPTTTTTEATTPSDETEQSTTTETIAISSSTGSTDAPKSYPDFNNNNDDYEYYYYDDDEQTERPSTTTTIRVPTSSNLLITTKAASTESTPFSTESPSSTLAAELSSTVTDEPYQATTISSLIFEEAEELIEPLSTTEPHISITTTTPTTTTITTTPTTTTTTPTTSTTSTTSTTTTTTGKEETTTEQILKSATTESIKATTYRPPKDFSDDNNNDDSEMTATTIAPKPEVEAEDNVEKNTEASINSSNNTTYNFQQEEEYFYSQEEYIAQHDPLEDEKIQEAQRLALQTALKNIRNRQQNVSSTTDKPAEQEEDPTKKFVRRPTNINSFPSSSSTSISVSFSSNNDQDEDELEDSRSNIIHKIQTFRTKLRKVVNRTGRKSTTTKRPRRVTRPSETRIMISTEDNDKNEVDEKSGPPINSTETKASHLSDKKVVAQSTPEITSTSTTTFTPEVTTSTTTTTESATTEKIEPEVTSKKIVDTPPVTLGSLIITEILPTSTQPSSTTEEMMMIMEDDTGGDLNKEPVDFETEEDDHNSTTTTTTAKPEVVEVTTTFSPITSTPISFQNETIIVETSTSRTIRERKVKVILKRRKGAPKGTGTVARQVVRTRTRRIKQEEKV